LADDGAYAPVLRFYGRDAEPIIGHTHARRRSIERSPASIGLQVHAADQAKQIPHGIEWDSVSVYTRKGDEGPAAWAPFVNKRPVSVNFELVDGT
jgi:hypothetical protein